MKRQNCRAEEMQTNVLSLQLEIIPEKTPRSAVAVTQGKSVVQKRLTERFRVTELIFRGVHSVRPSVTYQPPFRQALEMIAEKCKNKSCYNWRYNAWKIIYFLFHNLQTNPQKMKSK
jgi:hypothetical protein